MNHIPLSERFVLGEWALQQQDLVQTLIRLGLTLNQAKIYLALFRFGLSEAKTISKNTGIARSDIYRVIETLEKLGLVEKVISVPVKFEAIPISDTFSILIGRKMAETSELKVETEEILDKLETNHLRTPLMEIEDRFSLIPQQATTLKKRETLKDVQRTLDMITSWKYPDNIIFVHREYIINALERGVKIRVIMDKPEKRSFSSDFSKELKKYRNFKIRWIPNSPKALMEIHDKEKAWIYTGINPRLKEFPSLFSNNLCLLSILQDYFEITWICSIVRQLAKSGTESRLFHHSTSRMPKRRRHCMDCSFLDSLTQLLADR